MNTSRFVLGIVGLSTLAAAGAQAAIVSSWDFEEPSGSLVNDAGPANFDATIGAGTGSRVTTGDFGGALGQSWSGGTAEITTGVYTNEYDSLTSMTKEAWLKWNGTGTANHWLTINDLYSYLHTGAPGIRHKLGGIDDSYALGVPEMTVDQWTHWVNTYDAGTGTMKIFVNGVLKHTQAGGTGLNWAHADFDKLGLNSGGTYNDGTPNPAPFQGLIDRLRIHDVALTDSQVLAAYNAIVPEPTSLTVLGLGGLLTLGRRARRQ